MDDSQTTLSLVLFSGTDDRLSAAAVLVAGAAAMERPVNVFLQYWALDAFRSDRIRSDHGCAPEASPEGTEAFRQEKQHWADTLAQAKELGGVTINACALSMDTLHIAKKDLDNLVDGVQGVASFMLGATGPIVFV